MRFFSHILLAVFLSLLFIGCEPSKHRQIDVYLTVQSDYGSPTPPVGSNYLNYGMTITASVDLLIPAGEGTRYVCSGWTGTGSVPAAGDTSFCQFTITQNSTITWLWQTQYELTTNVSPLASGAITCLPEGAWYDADTSVQLTAVANAGYEFAEWSADLTGTANPQNLTMDGPKSVTANFTLTIWAKSYGGAGYDWAHSIQQTSDSGYVVAGETYSFGAGGADFWVVKLNSDGTISWQKTYGGADDDYAYSIQQTSDGGYIVAGNTRSFGVGYSNFWVLKLNSDGMASWQKAYGGTYLDYAYSVQQTSDGGYIVAGQTLSFGAGYSNFWVLKLNSNGAVVWQKTYGGPGERRACSIRQTSDGGYIVAGPTESFGAGDYDFWVLKLNGDGSVAWQKTYGGPSGDYAYSIQQTIDGGYIVAGPTSSFGASADLWVLKLNSDGTVAWQKRYGGADPDTALSIQQTGDSGYIVAGYTDSFGAGGWDFWVLKLNSDGTVAWQRSYGGGGEDAAKSIQQTNDGGYIVAGKTNGHFWVLKVNSDGTIPFNPSSGAQMVDTNAVPVDTNCTVVDTTATATNTTATVTDTNATAVDTDAVVEQEAP
jgi:uncharacterized delta-60 repeat protein